MNKNTIIELVDTNDPKAVRNKNNLLDCYDMIINKKQAMEGAMKYVTEDYIQHNPLLADGRKGSVNGLRTSTRNGRMLVWWCTRSSPLATICLRMSIF